MKSLILVAIATIILSSCAGYKLGDTKPAAMASVEKLAVPTFKNDTLEPRISVLVTNNVIQQLQRDGTYKITTKDNSDATLDATITKIERRPFRYSRTNFLSSEQLEYYLTVEYWVRDSTSGNVLAYGSVYGNTWGLAEPNLQLSERQALEFASRKVAIELMSKISEGW